MFEYVNHSMACVFRCPASNVKNANWLDKEAFALYHEVIVVNHYSESFLITSFRIASSFTGRN